MDPNDFSAILAPLRLRENLTCASMKGTVTDQDRDDISASVAGDEQAYARLVQRYEGRVASWMWRFTRDRAVLAELTQEVFVEAYFSLDGFKGRSAFPTWLQTIATRVGYHYWRKEKREREQRRALGEQWALAEEKDLSPSEAGQRLFALLAELPAKDRLVLTLHYFDECGAREIAERMGWSVGLVKVRLFRARQKLRALFQQSASDLERSGDE
jgi:RNA polymerase sigma-70 factor, ECF subfamily